MNHQRSELVAMTEIGMESTPPHPDHHGRRTRQVASNMKMSGTVVVTAETAGETMIASGGGRDRRCGTPSTVVGGTVGIGVGRTEIAIERGRGTGTGTATDARMIGAEETETEIATTDSINTPDHGVDRAVHRETVQWRQVQQRAQIQLRSQPGHARLLHYDKRLGQTTTGIVRHRRQ